MHQQTPEDFPRRLQLEGAPNVRDLGGYPTRGGGRTRWRRLLRGGRLSSLTAGDQALLADYDLRVICDFRHAGEASRDPSRVEGINGVAVHNLEIVPGSHSSGLADFGWENMTPADMAELMQQINREFALQQAPAFRRMFELLLATEDGGFLFHCSAGKDRTGFAAAMILTALGVPREVVMQDYLLTARYYPSPGEMDYLAAKYSDGNGTSFDPGVFHALMETREQYLAAAFAAIDEHYDSVDSYLQDALGLNAERRACLRARYLE